MNRLKTLILLAALTALLLWLGQLIGGRQGMTIALVLALVMNFGSYWFSDKIVLSMYRAQPVSEGDAPELYAVVRDLSQRAGIPVPKVYVIPEEAPNAFATGRNPDHAAVAATQGLLRLVDRDEVAGVLAHELGHVKNRDILVSSVAATIASAITYLAHMGQFAMLFGGGRSSDDEDSGGGVAGSLLMIFLAPMAAMLIQMAISRTREFGADAAAARYAGTPYGLISALRKLDGWSRRIPMDASPATAHMFIVQPFTGRSFMKLFSTHPHIEERIARLETLR